jgi:ankyrin repeat protein
LQLGVMEALMQSVGKGEADTVMRLLDEDPGLLEGVGQNKHRPLTKAAMDGQLKVVKLLLQRGANADATGRWGGTALHWAAFVGREEMATFLLSNGADAHRRDAYGRIPLIAACWKGHLGVVRVLVQHTGPQGLEETDDYGRTALHRAARGGHEDVVAYLLGEGAHADSKNDLDSTPLMSACWKGHLGVVRVLLQHTGAEGLEETDYYGRTVLHLAAKYGQAEAMALLLGQGADVNATTDSGRTPLMLACKRSHVGVVRVLLQHMGEEGLQATDGHGKTALHVAAEHYYEGTVRLLLLAGADPTVKDTKGRTPRALAVDWGNLACVAVFKVSSHPYMYQAYIATSRFV